MFVLAGMTGMEITLLVIAIVFGVLAIAFYQAMLQIETVHQAERMGFLNADALRAPMA